MFTIRNSQFTTGERQFASDQRLDAGGLRRLEEARRSVDAVSVHERDRGKTEGRSLLDQVLGQRSAVQEGEGRRDVQLGVRAGTGMTKVELPVALLQLLFARPRRDDERCIRRSDVA